VSAEQTGGGQTDHHSPHQGRMERAARAIEPVRGEPRADRDRDGGHLALPRESLPRIGAERLPIAPVASWTNASLSPATGEAHQDRPTRCDDHCPCLTESGKSAWGIFEAEQVSTYRELVRLHTQSLVRKLPAIRTRSRPWWWCFFPSSVRSRHDPCGQGALAVRKHVSACPGGSGGWSGGGVPGIASRPRGPFWSPHREEIGGGSGVHRQRPRSSVDGPAVCGSSAINSSIPRPISRGWKKSWSN